MCGSNVHVGDHYFELYTTAIKRKNQERTSDNKEEMKSGFWDWKSSSKETNLEGNWGAYFTHPPSESVIELWALCMGYVLLFFIIIHSNYYLFAY